LVLRGFLWIFVPLAVYAQPVVEVDIPVRKARTSAGSSAPADTETQPAVEVDDRPVSKIEESGSGEDPDEGNAGGFLPSDVQDPAEVHSLAQLDTENRKLGNGIRQGIAPLQPGARIRLERFLMEGEEIPLGIYWRNQLLSLLSSTRNRNFVILNDVTAQADYSVTGEIMRIGNILRLYIRFMNLQDSSLIAAWNLDLLATPFIEELAALPGGSNAAAAVRRDMYEPDSMDAPPALEIGAPELTRTLHQGDEDWFRVSVDADGILALETSGTIDTYMELYDGESGSRIASNDDGGEDTNARIEWFGEAGKTYVLKVRGLGGDTGSYRIKAVFNALPPDPAEPNDAQEEAVPIEPGTPVEANFHSVSDEDWYKLDIPEEGGFLIVYTEGKLDTGITLYDEEGTNLADNDDSGSRLNAQVSIQVAGGTVYIRVRELDGYRGAYTLQTRLREPGRSDAYEPDDAFETPSEIEIGTSQDRTFTSAGDVDLVTFAVTETGYYEIRTVSTDRNLDTYIELLDENGEYLADDDDGGERYDAYLRVYLEPGTYVIVICTLDEDPLDNNGYTLSVSASVEGTI
jgi:hypothetical protein